jgi:hypothetical protein
MDEIIFIGFLILAIPTILAIVAIVIALSARTHVRSLEKRLTDSSSHNTLNAQASYKVHHEQSKTQPSHARPMSHILSVAEAASLRDYIAKQTDKGVSSEVIAQNLRTAGWHEEKITAALQGMDTPYETSESVAHTSTQTMRQQEDIINPFIEWIKTDWLMKLGGLLLLIGLGWFVTYAYGEVGKVGRITSGIMFGLVVLGLGEWRIINFKHQGAILLSIGAGILMTTIFAAGPGVYEMFSSIPTLGFMFLVVLFLALSSVRHTNKTIAFLALILGYWAPLLASSGDSEYVNLFMYLLVVSSGVLWVVAVAGWRFLVPVSLVLTFFYSLLAIDGMDTSIESIMLVLAFAFAFLYFFFGVITMVKNKRVFLSDLLSAVGIGLFVLLWVMQVIDQNWMSLTIAIWALVFAIGAFMVYQASLQKEPFFIYGLLATGLIGVATALELDGDMVALTFAFAFEVSLVVVATHALLQNTKLTQRVSWLYIVPILTSLNSFDDYGWIHGPFNEHFFVLLAMMCTIGGVAYYFFDKRNDSQNTPSVAVTNVFFVIAVLYGLALVWLTLFSLAEINVFDEMTAIVLSLILYTIIGMSLYVQGRLRQSNALTFGGGILLGFVVLYLFILGWTMDTFGKITTYSIVGVLLISTAFMGRSIGKNTQTQEHTSDIINPQNNTQKDND